MATAVVFILFGLLAIAFVKAKKMRRGVSSHVECVQNQWRWSRALDQIETELRQWEIRAPLCLQSGFVPLEVVEGKQLNMFQIQESAPLLKPMKYDYLMEVSVAKSFPLDGQSVLCDAQFKQNFTIKKISQSGALFAVVETERLQTPLERMFQVGSTLVAFQPKHYVIEDHASGTMKLLIEKDKLSSKEMARGFTHFEISQHQDRTQFEISNDACKLKREVVLEKPLKTAFKGDWLLSNQTLSFEPFAAPKPNEGVP